MFNMASAVALLATGLILTAQQPAGSQPGGRPHAGHTQFDHCAKACADCMLVCEACGKHCFDLAVSGKAEHKKSAALCCDCAAFCATAAKIVASQGPLSPVICESCAKACETCAAECDKHEDEMMKKCAQSCRECAKACREMTGGR